MIKNIKFLYLAIILFLASITFNVPFPHKTLYDSTVLLFNIPIKTLNGLNYVGITSLLLLIISLYFLVKSLNKYHVRFVVITIFLAMFLPTYVVSFYQKTFATGIYSISYRDSGSHCSFQMINGTTLHGECELPLKNNSRNDVRFTVEFYEPYKSENDMPMVSLMNKNTSYNVMIRGKESKRVKFETNIDVSKMKEHINSGEITGGVNVIIKSGAKSRKL